MTTPHENPMPWEAQANELTETQVREQLARILATGALQAARKPRAADHEDPAGSRTGDE